MIKVVGTWELGWSTPICEYDLWAFPLRDFGVDEWYMCPVSGIAKRVTEVADVQTVIDLNLELTPVFVDEAGEIELSDFDHPVDALYVLGKAGYSPMGLVNGPSVRVSTPEAKGLLWPHQVICLVLYDRMSR